MSKNMAMDEVRNKQIARFQLGYTSYTGLNNNKLFKNLFKSNMGLSFDKNNDLHQNSVEEI